MMRVRRKVKPGQAGTKKLVEQYGAKLVCVRYRYDEVKQLRYKTAEIIVDQSSWIPRPDIFTPSERVSVRIDRVRLKEIAVKRGVQLIDAWWNSKKGVWEMKLEHALKLGLKGKIMALP